VSTAARAVFLDRDGVLNEAVVRDGRPHPPASTADVVLLDGVVDACRALHDAGWLLVVVTNQPDIARGSTTTDAVDAINALVVADLPVTDVVVCAHDDVDGCACRKPAPGMLTAAAERWGIDLASSVMVGDRWRDIDAGRRAGTRTIFIDRGYDEPRPDDADATVASLPEAATLILSSAFERTVARLDPEGAR
jgi:D-glycero-D-manno-heptose 1,7-bisphosphate phosphatase